MKLGNRPQSGEEYKLNKWYFGIEFRKCPPWECNVLRPFIFVYFLKVKDDGNEHKDVGFRKEFLSPIGINFRITRYGKKHY